MQSVLISSAFVVPFSIHVLLLTHTLNTSPTSSDYDDKARKEPDIKCMVYQRNPLTSLESVRYKFLCVCVFQSDLTKQQNGFKITLKTLEDNLLSRLSSASGNFLGDTELVENLETTKRTAAEIEEKVLFFVISTAPFCFGVTSCMYKIFTL